MNEPSRVTNAQKFTIAAALALVLVYFVVCWLWLNGTAFERLDVQTASVTTGAVSLLLVGLLVMSGYRLVSLPAVYLLYAWLFHFSLSFFCGLFPGMWEYTLPTFKDWAHEPSWVAALVFSSLCFALFAAGSLLALAFSENKLRGMQLPKRGDFFLFKAGMVVALASAAVIAGVVIQAGGIEVLSRSYLTNFGEGVFSRTFRSFTLYFAFGISFATAASPKKYLWLPIIVQMVLSAGMLLLGARGPALVSVFVMVIILYRRGIRLKPMPAAIALLALLYISSFVKQGRDSGGLVGNTVDTAGVSAAGGLLELGATLRTVSLMYAWIDDEPYAKQMGVTYWLPFERILGIFIPNVRQDTATDIRVFGAAINSREFRLGGSVIGEAYYNFGLFGALLFLPLGMLIGRLEFFCTTPYKMAGGGVIAFVLFYNIRDYFLPVPVGIATGLIMLIVIKHISSTLNEKRSAAQILIPSTESE